MSPYVTFLTRFVSAWYNADVVVALVCRDGSLPACCAPQWVVCGLLLLQWVSRWAAPGYCPLSCSLSCSQPRFHALHQPGLSPPLQWIEQTCPACSDKNTWVSYQSDCWTWAWCQRLSDRQLQCFGGNILHGVISCMTDKLFIELHFGRDIVVSWILSQYYWPK